MNTAPLNSAVSVRIRSATFLEGQVNKPINYVMRFPKTYSNAYFLMTALSSYTLACIFMTVATLAHLIGFGVYLSYCQEKHCCTQTGKRRSQISTSFNINLIVMIVCLMLMYSSETGIYVAKDSGTDTDMVMNILLTGRTVGFIGTEIAYINYSYDRAKGIFELTLPPSFATGFHWFVKTVPLLFLPAILFRIASMFLSSDEETTAIFTISRWYGAATAIITVLLDVVFLVSFALFLRANSPLDMAHSTADNSVVIIARYGAVGSSVYLVMAGISLAYAEWVEVSLRMLSYILLSVISVILTCLKRTLQKERIKSQADANAKLKSVLGDDELRRIRTRDTLPRGSRSPNQGSECVLVDMHATLSNLLAVKEEEINEQ
ncbi:hypothetical protein BJ741DRAFT_687626 [Chytriomyces cf. hyalinus JEL632]|nr:hypothetical protein BJ741DRAFT_687626 [Chytriomyces cf. hyalinus JEL632]